MRVPALSLPAHTETLSPEQIASCEAVTLLCERAAAVQPDFRVDRTNSRAVLDLCRRLDGMPLALELAAVRLEGLTVQQVVDGLDRELPMLAEGRRGAEARQQTLEATIGWSYGLLKPAERLLWARLSVFSGGFDEEGALAVCSGGRLEPDRVVACLGSLVEKSIVQRHLSLQPARYALLETVRQFGRQKLRELGEETEIQRKHADWILELARALGAFDERQAEMFRRMRVEHDNLWRALGFCLRQPDTVDRAVQMCTHLGDYWMSQGPANDVRRYLDSLIALTRPYSIERGKCLTVAAMVATMQTDSQSARQMGEESLRIAQRLNNDEACARSLSALIALAWAERRFDEGSKLAEQMLALGNAMGEKWVVARALTVLTTLRFYTGAFRDAVESGEVAASISRGLGEVYMRGQLLGVVAQAWWRLDELDRAEATARESARLISEIDDRRSLLALVGAMASMAAARGRLHRAAILMGCVQRLLELIATPLLKVWRERYAAVEEAARGALGEEAFSRAVEHGRSMTVEQIAAYVVDERPTAKASPAARAKSPTSLTRRELEIAPPDRGWAHEHPDRREALHLGANSHHSRHQHAQQVGTELPDPTG